MISGKLPNDTVWWLSTDGQKIWIESNDIEQERFKEKGCNIAHGRMFYGRKEVGELTGSRLESRKHKYAWIIKIDAMLGVYPELIEEIKRKETEENKKRKVRTKKNTKKEQYKKIIYKNIGEPKKDIVGDINNEEIGTISIGNGNIDNKVIIDVKEEHAKDYFHIDRPYVTWIKEEVDKTENGNMIISLKDLKSKMGEEFEKMDDFRIYYGLNKILTKIDIIVELKKSKNGSVALIKKT